MALCPDNGSKVSHHNPNAVHCGYFIIGIAFKAVETIQNTKAEKLKSYRHMEFHI